MIARLASPLFVKLAGIVGGVMLVSMIVMGIMLRSAWGTIEHQRNELAELRVHVRNQNAAVEQWQREARAARVRAAEALAQARSRAGDVERRARDAERPRPLSGQCRSPPEVMGAGL